MGGVCCHLAEHTGVMELLCTRRCCPWAPIRKALRPCKASFRMLFMRAILQREHHIDNLALLRVLGL